MNPFYIVFKFCLCVNVTIYNCVFHVISSLKSCSFLKNIVLVFMVEIVQIVMEQVYIHALSPYVVRGKTINCVSMNLDTS